MENPERNAEHMVLSFIYKLGEKWLSKNKQTVSGAQGTKWKWPSEAAQGPFVAHLKAIGQGEVSVEDRSMESVMPDGLFHCCDIHGKSRQTHVTSEPLT